MDSATIQEEEADVTMSSSPVGGLLQDHEEIPTTMMATGLANANGKAGGGVQFRSRGSIEEVRRISRISNYNIEEVICYWGDTAEHQLRKQELRKAAHEMQFCRRNSDNVSFTTLGIADKVGEARVIKKKNRKTATTAVLDEQDLQDFEGVYDDELLANVYTSTTVEAKKIAQQSAKALHEEVAKF
jgi:hypothetical protein